MDKDKTKNLKKPNTLLKVFFGISLKIKLIIRPIKKNNIIKKYLLLKTSYRLLTKIWKKNVKLIKIKDKFDANEPIKINAGKVLINITVTNKNLSFLRLWLFTKFILRNFL